MREEVYPLSITIVHSHVSNGNRGMPRIQDAVRPFVIHRAGPGRSPATGILFTWCDGYQSTIQDAMPRLVQHNVNLRDLVQRLIGDVGKILFDEDATISATLSWLASRHGAQTANYQVYDQETGERLRMYLNFLKKDVKLYSCSLDLKFACEEESEDEGSAGPRRLGSSKCMCR